MQKLVVVFLRVSPSPPGEAAQMPRVVYGPAIAAAPDGPPAARPRAAAEATEEGCGVVADHGQHLRAPHEGRQAAETSKRSSVRGWKRKRRLRGALFENGRGGGD